MGPSRGPSHPHIGTTDPPPELEQKSNETKHKKFKIEILWGLLYLVNYSERESSSQTRASLSLRFTLSLRLVNWLNIPSGK